MRTITSVQNPIIKQLRDLRHAKARAETGRYLVEGVKLCEEALRDAEVITVLIDARKAEALSQIASLARDVLIVPEHVLEAVAQTKAPQGVVASVRTPAPLDLEEASGPLLVLDGVQDPGNVGTMLRTAEAAGFTGALLSQACADPFAPKAVRATMGTIFRLPIWRGALPEALSWLQRKGLHLVSAELGGAPLTAFQAAKGRSMGLIIGSEGHGVSKAVSALADQRVSLPLRGRAESLNAAVAAGILMYRLTEGWDG